MNFDGPIPGQSLVGAPKAMPWERPPEITDPEDAIALHIQRLNTEERIEALLDMLQLDIDVKTLTEGIVRGGVANGVHSIDVGLIVSPVIHEFIVSIAEEAGIEFDEGLEDKEAKETGRNNVKKAKAEAALEKALKSLKDEDSMPPSENLEMAAPESSMDSEMGLDEATITEEPMPSGLMARRV